jgi:hypothetical protein
MALGSISPVTQQRLAVLVPLVALGISLFAVYPAWGRYRDLQAAVGREEMALETLKANPVPPPGPILPAAVQSAKEPPAFHGLVTRLADESGCVMAGYSVAPAESKSEQLARPLRATIELDCRYPQLRSFLYRASQAERVLTVTEVKVSTQTSQSGPVITYGPLKATVGLERYLTTAESQ